MGGVVRVDRAWETTTSTGTGTINLGGAVPTYRTLVAAALTGNSVDYCIADQGGGPNWEVGTGLVTAGSPDTLTRPAASVVAGSAGAGANAVFVAGTKDVFSIYRAGAVPVFITKPADEVRVSTTTLAADTDLIVPLAAGKLYLVHLAVFFGNNSTTANGGFKWDINFTGTVIGFINGTWTIAPNTTAFTQIAPDVALNTLHSISPWATGAGYHGYLTCNMQVNVSTAGILQFRWAQQTSDTHGTGLWGGSSLDWKTAV